MSLNFYRRVAFGLSLNDKKPDDPLNWALKQVNTVPDFLRREVFWGDNLPDLSQELFKV